MLARKAPSCISSLVVALLATVAAGCPTQEDVQCATDTDCDLSTGGVCTLASTGNQWCAYPDPACPTGMRFSDQNVGDSLSGECTDGPVVPRHTLTVHVGGNGTGNVASDPVGVSCSSGTCTGEFVEGSLVQLATTATSGTFLGWSDGCSGQSACALTMDADKTVGALFGTPGEALWSAQLGGSGEDFGFATTFDGQGNLIAVGRFAGTISIGTNAANDLQSAGGFDVFVAKLDGLTGDVIWAKRFGGTASEEARFVVVDATDNVYVSGTFGGTVNFGGGSVTSAGGDDVFALKLTPAGGFSLVRTFGGPNGEIADGIVVRGSALVVAGTFAGSMSANGTALTSAGSTDIFVASLALDGTNVWARAYGGTDTDVASGIAIDGSGNIAVGGRFRGTVDFGGGPLISAGNFDVLLLKITGAGGAHLFSRRFGSTAHDQAGSVVVDASSAIILLGSFNGTVDFGAGPLTASQTTTTDIFLAKYSQAGSCQWAKAFGGTGNLQGREGKAIAVNATGDVAITGSFDGTISFGGTTLSSASETGTDLFAARFGGGQGAHLNSIRAGGTSIESGNGIAQAPDGRFFVTGTFAGFAEFGGAALSSRGGNDGFVLGLAPL